MAKETAEQVAERDAWERSVGRAIVELYEEYMRRSMGVEAADDFLHEKEQTTTDPITNLRRKLRAS